MKNSMKIIAAAALFSPAAFDGVMAQSQDTGVSGPDTGTYYQGAERPVDGLDGGMTQSAPLVVQPELVPGGESAYYQGLDRTPGIDYTSTGSISGTGGIPGGMTGGSTQEDTLTGGESEYYQGATPDADLR